MNTDHHNPVTPAQVHAVTLDDDYFRDQIAEGLLEADRGESRSWDVEAMKADLIRRHGTQTNAS